MCHVTYANGVAVCRQRTAPRPKGGRRGGKLRKQLRSPSRGAGGGSS